MGVPSQHVAHFKLTSYVNYVSINLEKMKINIKNKEQSARLWRTRFVAVTLTS